MPNVPKARNRKGAAPAGAAPFTGLLQVVLTYWLEAGRPGTSARGGGAGTRPGGRGGDAGRGRTSARRLRVGGEVHRGAPSVGAGVVALEDHVAVVVLAVALQEHT